MLRKAEPARVKQLSVPNDTPIAKNEQIKPQPAGIHRVAKMNSQPQSGGMTEDQYDASVAEFYRTHPPDIEPVRSQWVATPSYEDRVRNRTPEERVIYNFWLADHPEKW